MSVVFHIEKDNCFYNLSRADHVSVEDDCDIGEHPRLSAWYGDGPVDLIHSPKVSKAKLLEMLGHIMTMVSAEASVIFTLHRDGRLSTKSKPNPIDSLANALDHAAAADSQPRIIKPV
jgi:hypothetical protein